MTVIRSDTIYVHLWRTVTPVLASLLTTACAGIFSSGPTQEEKAAFLEELDSQHLSSRERCFKLYRFDEDWAGTFSECSGLVDSLERLEQAARTEGATVSKGKVSDDVKVDKDFKVDDDVKVVPPR